MINKPDIDAMMAGELGQWLERQTLVRQAAIKKSNGRIIWAILICLPLLSFLWFTPLGEFRFFISFAIVAGAGVWIYIPRGKAKKDTKIGINSALAKAMELKYIRDCDASEAYELAKSYKMLPNHSRSSHEDLWSGEVAGHSFSLHESHLQQKQGSGKNSRWVTVFRGPIITIGGKKDFYGTTLLTRAGRHKKFLFFAEKDELKIDGQHLDRVDMVHPVFEDAFSIYSTDQVEARVLVDPLYVEKLIALENAFSGKNIRTLFHQGALHLILETDNMFESGSLDSNQDRRLVEQCIAQFTAMAQLAASLNHEDEAG